MYSSIKNVQILVSYMKAYGIKHVVLSPGGSDIPIIHSIETDSFFSCYSVVDERSAVYFGMGLSQQLNEPVACVCTSGTAVSNFMPGMTEAFYQDVPILAITSDKNPLFTDQLEIQKIDQMIFDKICYHSVDLPMINTEDEIRYCERLVCEAMLALTHHGTGPVQINIPTVGNTRSYSEKPSLEISEPIRYVDIHDKDRLSAAVKELRAAERIAVTVGQNVRFSEQDMKNIERFFEKYNAVILTEKTSNLSCKGTVNSYPVTETVGASNLDYLKPDIVISIGNNYASYNLKPIMRRNRKTVKHWQVDEHGRIRDMYQCLTKVFDCSVSSFFDYFANVESEGTNNLEYFKLWSSTLAKVKCDPHEISNFYVAKKLAESIPENSVLHLAILNSTRVVQFFPLKKNVRVYSNLGALGIDGCLSTFMGHAAATEELSYCLIGDLSFFYDMNAAGLRSLDNNVRIILLNNGGGSEFQFFMGRENISTIDAYICAEHKKHAEGWIKSLGYEYYPVYTKEDFDSVLPKLEVRSESPIFVEVFGDMVEEADRTKKLYAENGNAVNPGQGIKTKLKGFVKSVLSDEQVQKLKKG